MKNRYQKIYEQIINVNGGYAIAVSTGYILMALNILVQIILVPIYIRGMGKYQFGILMIVLSFANYAGVGTGWMSGGMLRIMAEAVARDDKEAFARAYGVSKLIYVGYAVVIAVGVALGCLSLDEVLFRNVPHEHRSAVQLSVLVASVYFVLQHDFSVERLAFIAMGHQGAGNLFQMLSLIFFALTVIPWLLSGGGLAGVFICLLGGVVAARSSALVYWRCVGVRVGWEWPDEQSREMIKRLIGPMGIGYFLYGMIVLTMQADAMLIGWLGGPAMVAEFVLVWKVAEVLIHVIWRLPEYYQPYLMRMDACGEKELLAMHSRKGLRWMVAISLAIGFSYGLLGPWIVKLWVGPDIGPQSAAAYILAGAVIFWLGSARLPAVVAYSTLRLKSLLQVAGVEVLGKLALSLILFPRIGYLAPLAAINIIHAGGLFVLYRRLLK